MPPDAGLPPPPLEISARAARRVREGHLWVFSNEVQQQPAGLPPGSIVRLVPPAGDPLGIAFFHPHSLIAARVLSLRHSAYSTDLLRERIASALRLRDVLFPGQPFCRLVHGESDLLPGLLIDRYGDALVVEILSAGMELLRDDLLGILRELLQPRIVVERSDTPLRDAEGLERRKGVWAGSGEPRAAIREGGVEFEVDLLSGQKTGFFYDQRTARDFLAGVSAGARVLDAFCYEGAFALRAARGGAVHVLGVDASSRAIQAATAHADRNGLADRCEFVEGDAVRHLRQLEALSERFDRIVLDPPSFAHRRKDIPAARRAYLEINRLGFGLLAPGGILITASCSHHIFADTFLSLVRQAALQAGVAIQILATLSPAPDHPVLPAMPETAYLKVLAVRTLAAARPASPPSEAS